MSAQVQDCPYYLVSRTSLAITAVLRRALAEAGAGHLKPAYLGVLMCLWETDQLRVAELGRCAGLEPSTMTGLLDRMERDGLVERNSDPDDRRAQRISLTEAGRAVREASLAAVEQTLDSMFAGIAEEEIDRTKDVLRRVLANAHAGGST